ncbi:hypothetical protein [Pontibacter burrus]|uniref:Uncharacterized protein n=1 Tax=Pontibacter burrus TaxID=2704466 RepID=A0A6B3LQ98_9BACT|nr:hypothetical protein [Pontibacter burrus]NEM96168.1 hypothetical protein [Pontibacter burrus]
MSALFATDLQRPVLREGYPLSLAIAISQQVSQPLYFERVYLDAAGSLLAIRATLIVGRGLLLLTETGPLPVGTATIQACVRNEHRATEADPVPVVITPAAEAVRFATDMERPVLVDGYPVQLSLNIGATLQTIYLEREYRDSLGNVLGIRSDVVADRQQLTGFNVHVPEPMAGTRYINLCLTNQYRDTLDELADGIYWIDSDGSFVSDFDNALIIE